MTRGERRIAVAGPTGALEVAFNAPEDAPRGIALVAHPHPLFGGTLENKVTHAIARAFVVLGYCAWRPNFRVVGASEGSHDAGPGALGALAAVIWVARR